MTTVLKGAEPFSNAQHHAFLCVAAAAALRARRYMPFAEGARNCVGQSLAKMSLAATIASLLQTFTFRLAEQARTKCVLAALGHGQAEVGLRATHRDWHPQHWWVGSHTEKHGLNRHSCHAAKGAGDLLHA